MEIPHLLSSLSQSKIDQGLQMLLSMVADGQDVHEHFGHIVKNVHSTSMKTREMASSLLIMFAQHEPELTLLIVNSVKKMLESKSGVERMQALHLVSALRVPTIVPIIQQFIEEAILDQSPLVRIAACQAIGQCYELDMSFGDELLLLLISLLDKEQTGLVTGWALTMLACHWPQRIDLLHKYFRVIVPQVSLFEDFCVVKVGEMLLRYAKHYLKKMDDDVKLLISSFKLLLNRMNSSVVLQAVSILHHLDANFKECFVVERLLALPPSVLVWRNIQILSFLKPNDFINHRPAMVLGITPHTEPDLRCVMLKSLKYLNSTPLTTQELNHLKLLAECWQNDQESLRLVLQTICTLCGSERQTKVIMYLTTTAADTEQFGSLFVSEALMALRVFFKADKQITSLIFKLSTSNEINSMARATLLYMLSTFAGSEPALCTEVLRSSLLTLKTEEKEVRLQVFQLAAKLMAAFKNNQEMFDPRVPEFFEYAMRLGEYDSDIDIRDRVRMFVNVHRQEDTSLANLLLQVQLPAPKQTDEINRDLVLNSASAYFHKQMGYVLGEYSTEDTSKLRQVEVKEVKQVKPVKDKPVKVNPKISLEEFLGE